jgi:hypothetical protein
MDDVAQCIWQQVHAVFDSLLSSYVRVCDWLPSIEAGVNHHLGELQWFPCQQRRPAAFHPWRASAQDFVESSSRRVEDGGNLVQGP